ncbi:hypothetical protein ABKN59_011792 [Abortiporus biennis]
MPHPNACLGYKQFSILQSRFKGFAVPCSDGIGGFGGFQTFKCFLCISSRVGKEHESSRKGIRCRSIPDSASSASFSQAWNVQTFSTSTTSSNPLVKLKSDNIVTSEEIDFVFTLPFAIRLISILVNLLVTSVASASFRNNITIKFMSEWLYLDSWESARSYDGS